MSKRLRSALRSLAALSVVTVLTLGAAQVLHAGPPWCGDDEGEIGFCPPYTATSCYTTCNGIYGYGGTCTSPTNGCCICEI